MLSKQLKGDERLGPVLDKIIQQSFRAAEIANGLLNFSRTSTTEFRDTNLNQVIRDTSPCSNTNSNAQIIVDLELTESLPPINGNPGKLQQVFLNLLLNAKEAMPAVATARRHSNQFACRAKQLCRRACGRFRLRHRARAPQAHLRSLLHHKTMVRPGDRRGTGLGSPSPTASSGTRRQNSRRKRRRRRTTFHLEFPLLRNSVHV